MDFGLSHSSEKTILEANSILRDLRGKGLSCLEVNFNILERGAESQLKLIHQDENTRILAARPLAGGFLTGKYKQLHGRRGEILRGLIGHLKSAGWVAFKKGYRATLPADSVKVYMNKENLAIVKVICEIAESLDISASELLVSWCLNRGWISEVVMAFRTHGQMSEIKSSGQLNLEITQRLDNLLIKQ